MSDDETWTMDDVFSMGVRFDPARDERRAKAEEAILNRYDEMKRTKDIRRRRKGASGIKKKKGLAVFGDQAAALGFPAEAENKDGYVDLNFAPMNTEDYGVISKDKDKAVAFETEIPSPSVSDFSISYNTPTTPFEGPNDAGSDAQALSNKIKLATHYAPVPFDVESKKFQGIFDSEKGIY